MVYYNNFKKRIIEGHEILHDFAVIFEGTNI